MKVSRMTDQLIKHLVSDLKSLEPLINSKLWMHCTVCLLIMAGIVLAMMGLRADYPTAIQDGAMLWKPGIFLLAWIGSMLLILDLSRPIERIEKWHFVPLFLAGTILLWQMIVQLPYLFSSDATLNLDDPNAIYCLSVIIGGGGIAMAMSWKCCNWICLALRQGRNIVYIYLLWDTYIDTIRHWQLIEQKIIKVVSLISRETITAPTFFYRQDS